MSEHIGCQTDEQLRDAERYRFIRDHVSFRGCEQDDGTFWYTIDGWTGRARTFDEAVDADMAWWLAGQVAEQRVDWIQTDKRLPMAKEVRQVLLAVCYLPHNPDMRWVQPAIYIGGAWWDTDAENAIPLHVVAWMPMPKYEPETGKINATPDS